MNNYTTEMMKACNKAFVTKVHNLNHFEEIFDIYDTEEEFNEMWQTMAGYENETFAEAQFLDTVEEVNGKYVFFNEVNYDWETGDSTLFNNN